MASVGGQSGLPGRPQGSQESTPESGRVSLEASQRERQRLRAEVELKQAKESLPDSMPLSDGDFLRRLEVTNENDMEKNETMTVWNEPEIVHNMDRHNINPDSWNNNTVSTLTGLHQIYEDIKKLGLRDNTQACRDFYDSMFYILRTGASADNPYKQDPEKRAWFRRPFDHISDLTNLEKKDSFVGGEQYVAALKHLQELRGVLQNYREHKISIAERRRRIDSGGTVGEVTGGIRDAISSNWENLQRAVREGDWMTAGAYAVGIYAFYRVGKKFYSSISASKGAKFLFWGSVAAAAGAVFAENAGYDVFRRFGIEGPQHEGTPFEYMQSVLQGNEHLRERTKDLDYGIVLKLEDVPLRVLHREFMASDRGETISGVRRVPGFIPPERFSRLFRRELEGVGHVDPERTGRRFTAKEREYLRIGRQLYSIAFAFREVYGETLGKDHPQYRDIPYEDAIELERGIRTPRELTIAIIRYTELNREQVNAGAIERIQRELRSVFGDISYFEDIKISEVLESGFSGELMGVPISIERGDDGKYKISINFPGSGLSDALREITLDSNIANGVRDFVGTWKARIGELISNLLDEDGQLSLIGDIEYAGRGIWEGLVSTTENVRRDISVRFEGGRMIVDLEEEEEESPDSGGEGTTPAVAAAGAVAGSAGRVATPETADEGTDEEVQAAPERPATPEEPAAQVEPRPEASGETEGPEAPAEPGPETAYEADEAEDPGGGPEPAETADEGPDAGGVDVLSDGSRVVTINYIPPERELTITTRSTAGDEILAHTFSVETTLHPSQANTLTRNLTIERDGTNLAIERQGGVRGTVDLNELLSAEENTLLTIDGDLGNDYVLTVAKEDGENKIVLTRILSPFTDDSTLHVPAGYLRAAHSAHDVAWRSYNNAPPIDAIKALEEGSSLIVEHTYRGDNLIREQDIRSVVDNFGGDSLEFRDYRFDQAGLGTLVETLGPSFDRGRSGRKSNVRSLTLDGLFVPRSGAWRERNFGRAVEQLKDLNLGENGKLVLQLYDSEFLDPRHSDSRIEALTAALGDNPHIGTLELRGLKKLTVRATERLVAGSNISNLHLPDLDPQNTSEGVFRLLAAWNDAEGKTLQVSNEFQEAMQQA